MRSSSPAAFPSTSTTPRPRSSGTLRSALAAAVRRKMEEHALPAPVQPRDRAHPCHRHRRVAVHRAVERQHALHIGPVAASLPQRPGAHLPVAGGPRGTAGGGRRPCRGGHSSGRTSWRASSRSRWRSSGTACRATRRYGRSRTASRRRCRARWRTVPPSCSSSPETSPSSSATPITKDMGHHEPGHLHRQPLPAGVRFHRHRGDDLSGARRTGGREVVALPRGREADRRGAGLRNLGPRRHRAPLKNPAPTIHGVRPGFEPGNVLTSDELSTRRRSSRTTSTAGRNRVSRMGSSAHRRPPLSKHLFLKALPSGRCFPVIAGWRPLNRYYGWKRKTDLANSSASCSEPMLTDSATPFTERRDRQYSPSVKRRTRTRPASPRCGLAGRVRFRAGRSGLLVDVLSEVLRQQPVSSVLR